MNLARQYDVCSADTWLQLNLVVGHTAGSDESTRVMPFAIFEFCKKKKFFCLNFVVHGHLHTSASETTRLVVRLHEGMSHA